MPRDVPLLSGGRHLAFGNGAASTDAEYVSVEFVHPVIVGKRALPALDVGSDFEERLPIILREQDMVMGFAYPDRDTAVERVLRAAKDRGALTFALVDHAVVVRSDYVPRIQEVQASIYPMLRGLIEQLRE